MSHTVAMGQAGLIPESRKSAGRLLIVLTSLLLAVTVIFQILDASGVFTFGLPDWRPSLYAYIVWAISIGISQVMMRGEAGHKALFLLPALLFTVAMVIFPTVFGFYIAFSEWNLSSFDGQKFNGLDNLRTLYNDSYFWNALRNMTFYVASVLLQYALAFGLALLLNADIRARKFFRVAFLLPFMLSPVAVSWMIGKWLRWDRAKVVTLTFCGGMRNISAGAVLAVSYFPAPVAVPVVLGMLFQQVLAALSGRLVQNYYEKKDAEFVSLK